MTANATLAVNLFGITPDEAHEKGICIRCKRRVFTIGWDDADVAEYRLSAICPRCWRDIFPTDGEE
jgi:hypothetical protein